MQSVISFRLSSNGRSEKQSPLTSLSEIYAETNALIALGAASRYKRELGSIQAGARTDIAESLEDAEE
jgi:hypothetical protein